MSPAVSRRPQSWQHHAASLPRPRLSAETLYKAVLLVFTAYLPKPHDLSELGRLCARACPDLGPLVPHDIPNHTRLAGLLRTAYIDARYNYTFNISHEDLETLAGYIHVFKAHAERVCRARIAALNAAIP